jgi:hypothetical protein
LRDAAALPRRIQPERDLWVKIAPQLRRGPLSVIDFSRHARTTLYAMAIAAAVVVAVSLGLMQPAPVPPAHSVVPVAANPAVPEPFEDDRAVLRAAYQVRADALDPTLRSVIDSNLSIIHESVDEIRMAMEKSPDNPRLEQMLMTACLSEVEMLRQFVHSSNEG